MLDLSLRVTLALTLLFAVTSESVFAASGECSYPVLALVLTNKLNSGARSELLGLRFEKTEPLGMSEEIVANARALADNCLAHEPVAGDEPNWDAVLLGDSDWSTRTILVVGAQILRKEEVTTGALRMAFAIEMLDSIPLTESPDAICEGAKPASFSLTLDHATIWRTRSAFYAKCPDGRVLLYTAERGWRTLIDVELSEFERQLDVAEEKARELGVKK